jgi:ankyrin repeat protein
MLILFIGIFEYMDFRNKADLDDAIRERDISLMKRKIAEGCDVNIKNHLGFTMLTRACVIWFHRGYELYPESYLMKKRGKLKLRMLKILLENGASESINTVDDYKGLAPIHYIVSSRGTYPKDQEKAIKLLISYGADINLKTKDGKTPLHEAIQYAGYLKTVEFLVQNGADVNAKDAEGKTPLKLAVEHNETEIAEFLRQHGAKE